MPSGVYERTEEARKNIGKASEDRIPWNKNKKGLQVPWNKGEQLSKEHKKNIGKAMTIHGGSGTRLYNIWQHMRERCDNNDNKYYGGRRIQVCSEWRNNFIPFRDFALSHGYKEGLTIDRIDNDGNYEPSNVQFITQAENISKANKDRIGIKYNKRDKPLLIENKIIGE